jgi:hypothetical protein
MSYQSERNFHLDRIHTAAWRAKSQFNDCADLESEHNVIKALTKSIVDELMALVETSCGERVWGFDVQHEGILDNVAVAFNDAIDKRDDRRSPESKAAAEADQRREMHNA